VEVYNRKSKLFELIQSLSKSEKRYFKLFANQHVIGEKNNYVEIFEAISRQSHYNEDILTRKFKGRSLLKHFSSEKVYLYNLILKSLRVYHANISAGAKIRALMLDLEILYSKGLYLHCNKLIIKGKQLAVKYDKHMQVLELISWENRIMITTKSFDKPMRSRKEIFTEANDMVDRIGEAVKFMEIHQHIFSFHIEKLFVRRKKDLAEIDTYFKEYFSKLEPDKLPYNSAMSYYNSNLLYAHINAQFDKHNFYSEKILALYEQHPHQIDEALTLYIINLSNHMISCVGLGQYEKSLEVISQIRKLPDKMNLSTVGTLYKFTKHRTYSMELSLYLVTAHFKEAKALATKLENDLGSFRNNLTGVEIVTLYYKFACVHISLGEYNDAIKWLNTVFNEEEGSPNPNFYIICKLLELMVHYDMGDTDFLEYLVRSVYRYLLKKKSPHKFEILFLKFVRDKMPAMRTKQELIFAFQELKADVLKLMEDPFERVVLEYFDFISWLDSKIENKPFMEIAERNAKKIRNKK